MHIMSAIFMFLKPTLLITRETCTAIVYLVEMLNQSQRRTNDGEYLHIDKALTNAVIKTSSKS